MILIAYIAFQLFLIVVIIFVIYAYLLPPLFGAPFVPTNRKTVKKMIEMARIKKGERAVDIGSGDGRIVIALAEAGAEAHGCEINPMLVWKSRRAIKKRGLQARAHIHFTSFRSMDFSHFDAVTVYGLPGIMKELEPGLRRMPAGGRIVSHVFQIPGWAPEQKQGRVYVYVLPGSRGQQ